MSDASRSSSANVIDDTKQYQTLRDRATEDTSNLRGKLVSGRRISEALYIGKEGPTESTGRRNDSSRICMTVC
ncbi:hypothetical protein LSAT2_002832 [Lamellibrachia satsuma]|nr:hypothetical protein LSAT2_002832 [Lamellibrachia satsuma]